MGKLWNLIEEWRDDMAYPPSYRKIAHDLGVSQSAMDTWKDPTRMPEPANLYAISALIGVPYHRVVDAVADDIHLYDESQARKSAEAKKKGPSPLERGRRRELDASRAAAKKTSSGGKENVEKDYERRNRRLG